MPSRANKSHVIVINDQKVAVSLIFLIYYICIYKINIHTSILIFC